MVKESHLKCWKSRVSCNTSKNTSMLHDCIVTWHIKNLAIKFVCVKKKSTLPTALDIVSTFMKRYSKVILKHLYLDNIYILSILYHVCSYWPMQLCGQNSKSNTKTDERKLFPEACQNAGAILNPENNHSYISQSSLYFYGFIL